MSLREASWRLSQRYWALEGGWREGLLFLALGAALALYYLPQSPWLTVLGALAFVWLARSHLELALLYVLFTVPFYRFPKAFEAAALGVPLWVGRQEPLQFSLTEFTLLACVVASVWQQASREGGIWAWLSQVRERWLLPGSWRDRLGDRAWASPVVLFALAATSSLLVSEYPRFALREYRTVILEPLLFYLLLQRVLQGPPQVRRFLHALVALGVVVALASLYHYLFVGVVEATGGVRRVLAVYHSPNALALFLGRVAPVALVLGMAGLRPGAFRGRAWLLLLGGLVILASLFLTYSRGAWLGVALALLVAAALVGWRPFLAAALGMAVLFLLALSALGEVERLASEVTNQQRLYVWQAAVAMIGDHPLLGVGPDNFLYQYPRYMAPQAWAEPNVSHPHNLILDHWARLGVLGVVALGWLQLTFWRWGWGALRRAEGGAKALVLALLASMVDFLAHGFVDNSYFLIDLAMIFWFTYAAMGALGRPGDLTRERG